MQSKNGPNELNIASGTSRSKNHFPLQVATCAINMKEYARAQPSQFDLRLKFKPLSVKCGGAELVLTIHSNFLREGKAT